MTTSATPEVTIPADMDMDTSEVIITIAASIGGLFLIVIIVFIIFVIYFYKKQINEERYDKKNPKNLRADRLDWKAHSFVQQFGTDINDVDEMLWREGGRKNDDETPNPAFGKEFQPLDVDNLPTFDSTSDDAVSEKETGSTSDMVEINMDDQNGDVVVEDDEDDDSENSKKKQISILDMKTWGQPGSSRCSSMRSFHGFAAPYRHGPPSPDEISSSPVPKRRSQTANPFVFNGRNSIGSQDGSAFPFSVSQPSNDPRFQYTRTNPLVAEAVDQDEPERYGYGYREDYGAQERDYGSQERDYDSKDGSQERVFSLHEPNYGSRERRYGSRERAFGGSGDIETIDFDQSNAVRGAKLNQSVVDFYESGTLSTGNSFNLSLEGTGSVGKTRLWQSKKFGGIGSMNTN